MNHLWSWALAAFGCSSHVERLVQQVPSRMFRWQWCCMLGFNQRVRSYASSWPSHPSVLRLRVYTPVEDMVQPSSLTQQHQRWTKSFALRKISKDWLHPYGGALERDCVVDLATPGLNRGIGGEWRIYPNADKKGVMGFRLRCHVALCFCFWILKNEFTFFAMNDVCV